MTTLFFFFVSFFIITNFLALCFIGFFLVDLSQKIFFYIQAIVDIFTADYNVYIVGADIPLAMANALGIPIPSGDDDPDKKEKTRIQKYSR